MKQTQLVQEDGRKEGPVLPEKERVAHFQEFHGRLTKAEQMLQAGRCMNC